MLLNSSIYLASVWLVVLFINVTSAEYCGYPFQNLPRWSSPIDYELDLTTNLNANDHLKGSVSIKLQAIGPRDSRKYIVIHAGSNLDIKQVKLYALKESNDGTNPNLSNSIKLDSFCHDDKFENLVIRLDDGMIDTIVRSPSTILMLIEFEVQLTTNGRGLIHYTVENDVEIPIDNDVRKQTSIFTRFGRFGAHLLFPCFNEARLKSTFKLKLNVIDSNSNRIQAISTSPLSRLEDIVNSEKISTRIFHFERSSSLSVNQFGFIISKQFNEQTVQIDPGFSIKLFNIASDSQFIKDNFVKTYQTLAKYFEMQLPMSELKIISINKLGVSLGVNFASLIIVDSSLIEYDDQYNDINSTSQYISSCIELLARQWIGYVATLEYDYDSWLFDGIVDVIGLQLADTLYNLTRYRLLFIQRVIAPAIRVESRIGAKTSLSQYDVIALGPKPIVRDPDEKPLLDLGSRLSPIGNVLDEAPRGDYKLNDMQRVKAISILGHVEEGCGLENYKKVMQRLVRVYFAKVVNLNDFIDATTKYCHWSPGSTIHQLRHVPGIPLIIASMTGPNTLTITQDRIETKLISSISIHKDKLWVIPIRYIYGDTSEYWTREASIRLIKNLNTVTVTLPPNFNAGQQTSWVKLNNSFKGFYRVLYSDNMLDSLINAARQGQLSDIDCLNLLDDARAILETARKGAYYLAKTIIGLSSRQSNEILLAELLAAFHDLNRLYQPINQPINRRIRELGIFLFKDKYLQNGFNLATTDASFLMQPYELLIQLDFEPLAKDALEVFRSPQVGLLDPRFHTVIFMAAARFGTDQDFNQLLGFLTKQSANRSQELDRKFLIGLAMANTQDRLESVWDHVKLIDDDPGLIDSFIRTLMNTEQGFKFIRSVIIDEFKRPALINRLGLERSRQLAVEICVKVTNTDLCNNGSPLAKKLKKVDFVALATQVHEERKRIQYIQLLDLNKFLINF